MTTRAPGALTLTEGDRRVLAAWAADCAARALAWFERAAPTDARPRLAIAGARGFARGEVGVGAARALAAAAHAAARDARTPAAMAAARAAGHAAAVAHMAAHALGAPAYAARAIGLGAGPAAATAYCAWAVAHAATEVRAVLARLPARSPSRGRLGALIYELHVALTGMTARGP